MMAWPFAQPSFALAIDARGLASYYQHNMGAAGAVREQQD